MNQLRRGGFLIAKIHQTAGRIFARKLKEYRLEQINPAQGRILFALWEQDNISIQELARKTSLGKSTLTSMLDRLGQDGHLNRIRSQKDRRKVIIRLTAKDKKLRALYRKISAEMAKLFYRGFNSSEIDRFEENLTHILENLENGEKEKNHDNRKLHI